MSRGTLGSMLTGLILIAGCSITKPNRSITVQVPPDASEVVRACAELIEIKFLPILKEEYEICRVGLKNALCAKNDQQCHQDTEAFCRVRTALTVREVLKRCSDPFEET